MFQKSSKSARVYTKIDRPKPVIFVVDRNPESWNSFFDVILDWAPKLKQIYKQDNKLDNS